MYIELFLLDNFIFDMLILKLASALSTLKYSNKTAVIICLLTAVYSAFAVKFKVLASLPAKFVLCFVFSIPFFKKQHKISFLPIAFVLISTFIAGGISFAFRCTTHGIYSGGWLRNVIYPAFILSMLPSILRHIKRTVQIKKRNVRVRFRYNQQDYAFDGIIDSGNTLHDVISGLPVIIIYAPELMIHASIPLFYSDTTTIRQKIYAFSPDELYIDETGVEMLLAPTDKNPNMKAIVPLFNLIAG